MVEVHTDVAEGRYTRSTRRSKSERVTLVRFADVTVRCCGWRNDAKGLDPADESEPRVQQARAPEKPRVK